MSERFDSVERAVETFLDMRRRGEPVARTEFVARHAYLGADLAEALEAFELLQELEPGPEDVAIPERVGPYRVVRELGRGGMGIVLEAVEEPLGRRVALKLLPAQALASPSARTRFQREAAMAARLDHPGIATIYGTGITDGRPWIAMRHVEGRTLASIVAEAREAGRRFPRISDTADDGEGAARDVARCLAQIARALHAAHEQGVVHRDVKPSNVIVSPDGTPVLVDFGLAVSEESEGMTVTRTGETAGTPAYIAPEIVSGSRARPDAQVDVYALGVTLYECLALRRPFEGPTPVALYRAILSDPPTGVSSHNARVPRDLAVITATAIERERERRYASAAAFAADLEAFVDGRPIAARPIGVFERAARWARREPRQAGLVAAFVVAAIGAAAFAGTWWASRGEVHAAEKVLRDVEFESELVAGFSAMGDETFGKEHFDRALGLKPDGVEALAGIALSAISRKANDEARDALSLAPHTLGFEALRAVADGRTVEQDRELARAGRGDYLDSFLAGVSLLHSARTRPKSEQDALARRAMRMLDMAVERSPRAREFVHVWRAWATYDVADETASRNAAESLVALWPDSFHALVTAGSCLVRWDPAHAKALLERAHEMRPNDPTPLHELALLAYRMGEADSAEALSRESLRHGDDPTMHVLLGSSLSARGCTEEAREVYLRALARAPYDEQALQNLAQGELEAKRPGEGVFWLERLLQHDPWHPVGHYAMGLALRDLGEREAAEVHALASVALDPSAPYAWAELVWLEGLLDRWETARDCADAGLSACPGDPRLTELRGRIAKILAKRRK